MPRRPIKSPSLPELVVATPEHFSLCVDYLRTTAVIGFDTEFVGEDSYRPELCLIQIATSDRLFVIDPFAVGPLEPFWRVLTDPAVTVVMHAGREDIRICYFAAGRPPAAVFDIQIAAGLVGFGYPVGYAGLVQDLLGHRMSKGETLTDWRRRPLLPAQMRYAFDDVRFLLPAWRKLTDRLRKYGRTSWAADEFATFVRRAVADDATTERWRKLKGLGSLDPVGLAVARAVFGWRDGFAARVNRPPRMLLRDDLLAEIARRMPTRPEDLLALRGVPRGEADAILEAVRGAVELPPAELPDVEARENDPAHIQAVAALMMVVLGDACARGRLANGLVGTGQDIKSIVRARAAGDPLPDVPLTRGWRAAAILPELLGVLDGTLAVRVRAGAVRQPLEYVPVAPPADAPESSDTL